MHLPRRILALGCATALLNCGQGSESADTETTEAPEAASSAPVGGEPGIDAELLAKGPWVSPDSLEAGKTYRITEPVTLLQPTAPNNPQQLTKEPVDLPIGETFTVDQIAIDEEGNPFYEVTAVVAEGEVSGWLRPTDLAGQGLTEVSSFGGL